MLAKRRGNVQEGDVRYDEQRLTAPVKSEGRDAV